MTTQLKTEEIDNTVQSAVFSKGLLFAAVTLVIYLLILATAEKLPGFASMTATSILPSLWLLGTTLILKRGYVSELLPAEGQHYSINFFCRFTSIVIFVIFLASFLFRPVDFQLQLQPAVSLASLSIVLLVPVAEELFFRGYLLSLLTVNFNRFYAAGLVSLLFCFLHLRSDASLAVFLFSLLLCHMVLVTNRIAPAIIAHICWNAVSEIWATHSIALRALIVVVAIIGIFAAVPLGAKFYDGKSDR
jgi:membrane protease YdiL (CAAX protease family)